VVVVRIASLSSRQVEAGSTGETVPTLADEKCPRSLFFYDAFGIPGLKKGTWFHCDLYPFQKILFSGMRIGMLGPGKEVKARDEAFAVPSRLNLVARCFWQKAVVRREFSASY
jgi:hypothetical protein